MGMGGYCGLERENIQRHPEEFRVKNKISRLDIVSAKDVRKQGRESSWSKGQVTGRKEAHGPGSSG